MDTAYYNSKGWFWRCDDNCLVLRGQEASARLAYEDVLRDYNQEAREVRSIVGVFSDHAVAKV
jgi:hypothetical protein